MQQDYLKELGYLRRLAQELTDRFPEISDMVSGTGQDEAADRLFQGAALILARLGLRIHDQLGPVLIPLFRLRWPQFLRPLPSATLVQFSLDDGAFHQTQVLEPGISMKSERIDGEVCYFETREAIELAPVELAEVQMGRPVPSNLVLTLKFQVSVDVAVGVIGLKRLAVHFGGALEDRYRLFYWLHYQTERIVLKDENGVVLRSWLGAVQRQAVAGAEDALEPPGGLAPIGLETPLMIGAKTPLPGLQTLAELSLLPEKFLGFSLGGLEVLSELEDEEEGQASFSVEFHLGDVEGEVWEPKAEHFMLGCAPALNIGPKKSLELQVEKGRAEFRLAPKAPEELFEIEGVRVLNLQTLHWTDYRPILSERDEAYDLFYEVVFRPDGVVNDQCHIVTLNAEGEPTPPQAEKLMVEVRNTNGVRAARLAEEAELVPTTGRPSFVTITTTQGATPPRKSLLSRGRLMELFAMFSTPVEELLQAHRLNLALELASPNPGDEGREPILSMQTRGSVRLGDDEVVPIRVVEVELRREAFSAPGEMLLFGMVLYRFVKGTTEHGALTELRVGAAGLERAFVFSDMAR